MANRLVYSPKAWVFTKNSAGEIIDLTDYVTAGGVERLINQASTAEITLRNPNRMFTSPANPIFHPMDSITIYLERIRGYPVQVFTGYLDDTPFYQMFPGTITLSATCTLKRLVYSYFDPSLPYVNSFFASYGWIADQQGAIYNTGALSGKTTTISQAASGATNLEDGSIGKLLYATVKDIGNWDDTNIYIENIPSGAQGLGARIGILMENVLAQQQIAAADLTTFLDGTIGTSSQGSGAGMGGGLLTGSNNAEKAYNYLSPIVGDYGAAGIIGNMAQEAGGGTLNIQLYNSPSDINSYGIINWTPKPSDLSVGADLETQLAYVKQELIGAYSYVAAQLQQATSPSQAADIYCHGREEPQVPIGGDESVVKWTVREACAEQAYRIYHNNQSDQQSTAKQTYTVSGPNGQKVTIESGSASGNYSNSLTPATSGKVTQGQSTTVFNAIVNAADAIAQKGYPYELGGGHAQVGTPSSATVSYKGNVGSNGTIGFDCSGGVAAVLSAAGDVIVSPGSSIGNDASFCQQLLAKGVIARGPGTGSNVVNLYDYPGAHMFMSINGTNWGTYNGASETATGNSSGGDWLGTQSPGPSVEGAGLVTYHVLDSVLKQSTTYSLGLTGSGTLPQGSSGTSSITSTASAEAFTAQIDFPSIEDMSLAIMLGGVGNGLMHDQQLLPFVQQLTQASMRSFQSLPNGDFYAFFPDYFGEFDQHPAYWEIDDVEILSGDIYLSDDTLVTHQYVVGENTYPASAGLYNELFSTGVITIYNAFQQGFGINGSGNNSQTPGTSSNSSGLANVMNQNEAIEFVKRYGARPAVSNYPQVRSSLYEMFLAYQEFMAAWANQFRTTFEFTFMPEIYPGGKVSFPNHGIQMYVQSVSHTWDYEAGFTTSAQLTAPSKLPGTDNKDIPDNMVQALVNPIRSAAAAKAHPGITKPTTTQQSQIPTSVDLPGVGIVSVSPNGAIKVP